MVGIVRWHSCRRFLLDTPVRTRCRAPGGTLAAEASEPSIRAKLYPESEYVDVLRPASDSPPNTCVSESTAALISPDVCRGSVVGRRYMLFERVGSGGTATVYRAHDRVDGCVVAVKLLHQSFAGDGAVAERFQREGRTAERFRHRNIVRTFDHGVSDGMPYIAMEHIEGRPLNALIAQEAPLESARAIEITLQILEATRFIHDHGVIHRDLKPGNVLVDPNGLVKLTDFGIARLGASDMTPAGSLLGTISYVSPERLMGERASRASDLYSIGIILYELLTGRLPFGAELVSTVALKHLNERPTPPARLNRTITGGLNGIVLRALEKSPQARFSDAEAFSAALRREPTGSRRTSAPVAAA